MNDPKERAGTGDTVRGDGRAGPTRVGWRAALFDLDGTLADTVPLILSCYRHTMRTHIGRELPDEDWLRTLGTPLTEQLKDFARDGEEEARMLATYVTYQREVHDQTVRAFEGTVVVLEALRLRGVRMGVVTSKKREMALRTLGCCGLLDYVEVLVAADDVRSWKPHPEPVRAALRALELESARGEVIFVGDSPFDIRAGRAAGVRTAALLKGPFPREVLMEAGPDHVLDDLEELLVLTP